MRGHDLRHSFASIAQAEGLPAAGAMAALGHSSMTTTSGIYTHASDPMRQMAADIFDAYHARITQTGTSAGADFPALDALMELEVAQHATADSYECCPARSGERRLGDAGTRRTIVWVRFRDDVLDGNSEGRLAASL